MQWWWWWDKVCCLLLTNSVLWVSSVHEKNENAVVCGCINHGHASTHLDVHVQAGNQEALEKYSKRTVKVTREHNEECKRLLSLMGVPYVEVCVLGDVCWEMCIV